MVPTADQQLTFKVEGAGTLMAAGNADIKDEDPYFDATHRAWKGRALSVVRTTKKPGKVRLTVSAASLPGTVLTLETHAETKQ